MLLQCAIELTDALNFSIFRFYLTCFRPYKICNLFDRFSNFYLMAERGNCLDAVFELQTRRWHCPTWATCVLRPHASHFYRCTSNNCHKLHIQLLFTV